MLRNAVGGTGNCRASASASPSPSASASRGSWSHILPGRLRIERGTYADYRGLEHFHYVPGRPRIPVGVWRVVYETPRPRRLHERRDVGRNVESNRITADCHASFHRVVAVGVLAYPPPASRARERTLGLAGPRYGPKLAFVNRHVRTIARIIVHPQFRSLGVAARLVRRICDECPTRYVEAFAAMGDVHPFFEKGGMTRVAEAAGEGEAAYFIFDREKGGRHAK